MDTLVRIAMKAYEAAKPERVAAFKKLVARAPVSVVPAQEYMLRWCCSYTRLLELRLIQPYLRSGDFIELAGRQWPSIDDAWKAGWLIRLIRESPAQDRLRFMSADERKSHAGLPPTVIAYRGCYDINRRGVSFSLSEDEAQRFPMLNRYHRASERPILVKAKVKREDVLLKLDRGEQEVLLLRRRTVSVTSLRNAGTSPST